MSVSPKELWNFNLIEYINTTSEMKIHFHFTLWGLIVTILPVSSACNSNDDNCYEIFSKKNNKKWTCHCSEEQNAPGRDSPKPLDDDDVCEPYNPKIPDFRGPNRRKSTEKCYEYIWRLKVNMDSERREKQCKAKSYENIQEFTEMYTVDMQENITENFQEDIHESIQENIQVDSIQEIKETRKKRFTYFIIGGHYVFPAEYPHMGAIGWLNAIPGNRYKFLCGSALISLKFVLTAAHCSQTSSRDTTVADVVPKIVRFGVEDIFNDSDIRPPLDVNIMRIIVHPEYKSPMKYFDIALMELDEAVTFTKFVHPACLWNGKVDHLEGLTVTGWGVTSENAREGHATLQEASLDIVNDTLCNRLLRPMCSRLYCGLQKHQFCAGQLAGGVDACQGDSGGPLQFRISLPIESWEYQYNLHHIVGVTSFGIGCGEKDIPGVYTKVPYFIDWIESIVWQ